MLVKIDISEIKKLQDKFERKLKKAIGLKPDLPYFEFHLADHCNLNCKGCSHFSPIRDEYFAELEEYRRDLVQLQSLFSSVWKIILLGGEPLLHPQVVDFLLLSRSFFPKANLAITTNGILLPKMPERFWDVCRSCSVNIYYTVYPPFKKTEHAIIQLATSKGVRISANIVNSFHGFYNKKGDTNVRFAFKKCRSRFYCPMLRNGRLYVCCLSCNITVFNKRYGLKIPEDGFINIHEPGINGWRIIDRLSKPSPTCSYCALGWENVPIFPWKTSKVAIVDWDAEVISAGHS
jgi:hypothetical protein